MDYLIDNKVQESQNGSFVCLLCGVVIKVSEWTNQSHDSSDESANRPFLGEFESLE